MLSIFMIHEPESPGYKESVQTDWLSDCSPAHWHCKLTAACFMGIFDLSFLQAILGILVEMHFAPASQVMDELTVIGFPLSDHFV